MQLLFVQSKLKGHLIICKQITGLFGVNALCWQGSDWEMRWINTVTQQTG